MGIGENVKRLREARGMRQSEVADRLCISRSMLCQIERGTKALTLPLAKEIAEIFGCSVDDLLKQE